MKTTIDLPEEVLKAAKVHAAQNQTTLKELVLKGLRLVTGNDEKINEKERQKKIKKLFKKMVASNTEPMDLGTREERYDR